MASEQGPDEASTVPFPPFPLILREYGSLAPASPRPDRSMPLIQCPQCGEDDDLHARRGDDGPVTVVCGSCGHGWMRDSTLRCQLCGSTDLRYTPEPLWEKGRGDQRTPAGKIDQYACWTCGGRRVTSAEPVPAGTGEG